MLFPGACYHVTARGNERQRICPDARDREPFRERLAAVVRRYRSSAASSAGERR